MKSLIFKQTTTAGNIERTAIYVFGICIYSKEEPYEPDAPRRPIGFTAFPQYAPECVEDEDYYPEEYKYGEETK
ncbi:hypothetical protein [Muribaculum intestinale]|uniref:Uncharacterized protein n=1 Tax=Muribaculum intestinale TaxID=1796646 RepID=A0A4S2FY00_9BACT|nr:hypothetical protein [Muribaculum intestinale]MYM12393.1 hypothetical protein [Muribaculum intestinale]TGY74182.1 hypothetical protein E5333_07085 [Muribaculum intestinale]